MLAGHPSREIDASTSASDGDRGHADSVAPFDSFYIGESLVDAGVQTDMGTPCAAQVVVCHSSDTLPEGFGELP